MQHVTYNKRHNSHLKLVFPISIVGPVPKTTQIYSHNVHNLYMYLDLLRTLFTFTCLAAMRSLLEYAESVVLNTIDAEAKAAAVSAATSDPGLLADTL